MKIEQTNRMSKFFLPPTPLVKLVSIGAFYKNDSEGGIGIIIPKDNLEFIMDLVLDMLEGWESDWLASNEKDRNKLYANAVGQLEHWGSSGIWQTQAEGVLAIANIGFLERHSKIPDDNYNGLILQWEKH
ncbi:MAG: hypothetical protein U0X76_13405 [Bacteroidia bacterium]|nr:hypothetical protein [Bacteroidia bacterium]